jgi:hypothetical protein
MRNIKMKIPGKPNIEELRELYRCIVCPEISEKALNLLSFNALRKSVVIFLVEESWPDTNLSEVARFFGLHVSTVSVWTPSKRRSKGDVVQCREGIEIARYTSISEAAKETNIPYHSIYASINNGWKSRGFNFQEEAAEEDTRNSD